MAISLPIAGWIRRGVRWLDPRKWIRLVRTQRRLEAEVAALGTGLNEARAQLELLRDDLHTRSRLITGDGSRVLPPPGPNGFRHEEINILGSGPSLLELTDAEREALRRGPTVAMNRYLAFWDLVGVWPTYVFLADRLGVAPRVLDRSIQIALGSANPPIFLLENGFRLRMPETLPTVYFLRPDNKPQLDWADSLDARLYSFRGSLTTLLNLCSVLRLAPRIRLVGVDLDRPGAFFDSARAGHPGLFNPWDDEAAEQGLHATVASIERWGGARAGTILDRWPELTECLRTRGIQLGCAGATSLLVKRELCQVDPIVPGRAVNTDFSIPCSRRG